MCGLNLITKLNSIVYWYIVLTDINATVISFYNEQKLNLEIIKLCNKVIKYFTN